MDDALALTNGNVNERKRHFPSFALVQSRALRLNLFNVMTCRAPQNPWMGYDSG